MLQRIDVNVEAGESFGRWPGGDDEAVMPHVSSASVACGFHAGDYNAMLRMVELGQEFSVAIGAHPGYSDLLGFGYRPFDLTPKEVRALLLYQLGALDALLRSTGQRLHHVKPHGALYMQSLVDPEVARAVVDATASFDEELLLYTSAGSVAEEVAGTAGVRVVREFFADRPLRADGSLLVDWATYFDPSPAHVAERVLAFLSDGAIPAVGGGVVEVEADCICMHTDNPAGAAVAVAVKEALRGASVEMAAP